MTTESSEPQRFAESAAPGASGGVSVMRQYLTSAIETHPALWERMGQLYRARAQEVAYHHLAGMVEALAIVGAFDTQTVWERLVESFA